MFDGSLIKLNGVTPFPNKFIRLESYAISPNQRLEQAAERDLTGVLHRKTLAHTPSKIEFETPYLRRQDVVKINSLLQGAYANSLERKLSLVYYVPDCDGYQTGNFYVPDIKFTIYNIDAARNDILYLPTRIAFIEY